LARVQGPQHFRRSSCVVVLERPVVVVIEITGGVFAIEVANRLQEEPALLLQVGQGIEVDRLLHDRSSSRSTRARSSGETATPARARHRRNVTARPAKAAMTATTGRAHTRPATPEPSG